MKMLLALLLLVGYCRAQTILAGSTTALTGQDSNAQGQAEAFMLPAIASGTVGSVAVDLLTTNVATQVQLGIYSNSNSCKSPATHCPSQLWSVTTFTAVPGTRNIVSIKNGPALVRSRVYWIALLGINGSIAFRDNCCGKAGPTTAFQQTSSTAITALLSTWGAGGNQHTDGPLSGYISTGIAEPPTNAPVFSPASGGTFTTPQAVNITDSTPNASIYYTTNGTIPTTASTLYSGTVAVSRTTTFEAVALAPGFTLSAVTPATYTINGTVAHQVTLQWTLPVVEPTGTVVTGIQLFRQTGTSGGFTVIANLPPSAITAVDTNVVAGQLYQYEVEMVAATSQPTNSAPSNVASATIPTP